MQKLARCISGYSGKIQILRVCTNLLATLSACRVVVYCLLCAGAHASWTGRGKVMKHGHCNRKLQEDEAFFNTMSGWPGSQQEVSNAQARFPALCFLLTDNSAKLSLVRQSDTPEPSDAKSSHPHSLCRGMKSKDQRLSSSALTNTLQ